MNHRQQELDAMPKHRPSKATVEEWTRQLERLKADAKSQRDWARLDRLLIIENTINKQESYSDV